MKILEGNIVDIVNRKFVKGRLFFNENVCEIKFDFSITNNQYILPGLVDAHVHIESSMLTPLEYSKIALKHGVIAAVTDPHEIANVCGIDGVRFMLENAKLTPMKLFFGSPSCVPATSFETSGATLGVEQIEELFKSNECSHLSEMMNIPGVIFEDKMVVAKINLAKKHNKLIDGHAPQLTGSDLRKYVRSGISTDHECTTLHEALEKISLGMKIMLRNSSASKDFQKLISLIHTHPNDVMLCTDDCHPDELQNGYINLMVKEAMHEGYDLFDALTAATQTAAEHYDLKMGLLQLNDPADFIIIDNLDDFTILSTYIGGEEIYNSNTGITFKAENSSVINQFYSNQIGLNDLLVERKKNTYNVIQVIENSLLTKRLTVQTNLKEKFIQSDLEQDILKIVVLNRYQKAKPSVGFIKGFNLNRGAIAGTISHDSHNIVALGVHDSDIHFAIEQIQKTQGGLVVVNKEEYALLPLPVAGLMSDKSCTEVAEMYKFLSAKAKKLGSTLNAPFMTLAFMSLLVIPELKISDKGLFDVNEFCFIDLQN